MPSLGATFGRGAATMPQWDLANADSVLVMGSNMAENHPIAFRFVMQAKRRGATVIHADPRFTRTSAMADSYAPLRAGTDIAFLGGIIRHVLEHDRWFRDYALAYTNLSTIVDRKYLGPEELDGLFSGWKEEEKRYSVDTWQYDGVMMPSSLSDGPGDRSGPAVHGLFCRSPRAGSGRAPLAHPGRAARACPGAGLRGPDRPRPSTAPLSTACGSPRWPMC